VQVLGFGRPEPHRRWDDGVGCVGVGGGKEANLRGEGAGLRVPAAIEGGLEGGCGERRRGM
jgi:hypothetical protein